MMQTGLNSKQLLARRVIKLLLLLGIRKEWTENDRKYFHYEMDAPILNFYSFISAEFAVQEDYWLRENGIRLQSRFITILDMISISIG